MNSEGVDVYKRQLLHISDTQLSYVTDSEAGRGLLKMGGSLVPFINDISKDTRLYKLMSTRPNEKFL